MFKAPTRVRSARHRRRWAGLGTAALVIAAVTLTIPATTAVADGRANPQATQTGAVRVDTTSIVGPINRGLLGFHGRYDAHTIATAFDAYGPTTQRHVMSDYDFMDYDCSTRTISPASITYFGNWIDAVTAQGARPILSMSYVPPCLARDGQPKGPPADVAGYRDFLDQLFTALVTDRAAAGKEPMRWFELWNEPDIPIDPGNPGSGHGYVGTLQEFLELNLPSLVGAILDVEAASGIDLHIGTPAAFSPWSFGSIYGDLAGMLEHANGFDPATAATMAPGLEAGLGQSTVDAVLNNGGFTWPRAATDAAARMGLRLDFASVHLYPNNPLQTLTFPEPTTPTLLAGRNPDASPNEYARLAQLWHAEFPDQELIVSEWAISAGSDARFGTCEAASFDAASLSVMQDTAIDRALFLGLPWGVEDAPFRAWHALPDNQVAVTGPEVAGTWHTAATGDGRSTLLLSQWHAKLTDAQDLRVPVEFTGLADGPWTVTIDTLGQGTSPAVDRIEITLEAHDGRLEIPGGVALRGQSLVRVDVRGSEIAALPALSAADATGTPQQCLATTPATSNPATTTPGPVTTIDANSRDPHAATPIRAVATYTG